MELVFTDREGPEERWLAAGGDAEALVAAPVTPVTEELIARMPHLKLIHSDGVGYDRIDLAAAREGGIYVCNCAGCNAGPVAELAVTLMSMLLHRTLWGDRMVRAGQQHEAVNELAAHVPEAGQRQRGVLLRPAPAGSGCGGGVRRPVSAPVRAGGDL